MITIQVKLNPPICNLRSYDSFTLNWRPFCLLGITFDLVRVYSPKDYPSINRLNESSLTSFIILKHFTEATGTIGIEVVEESSTAGRSQ